MKLLDKLRRHLPPDFDFNPEVHWPLVRYHVRARFKHNGLLTTAVRHLMNADLAIQGQPPLHPTHNWVVNTCEFPEVCINPRHHEVKSSRVFVGKLPNGIRCYNYERYPIPVFSWQLEQPADFDDRADIMDCIGDQLDKIFQWQLKPAQELLALVLPRVPEATIDMIEELQQA